MSFLDVPDSRQITRVPADLEVLRGQLLRHGGGKLRKGSRCLMKLLRFSVEYGFSGEARILRLPNARGPKLHPPLHPRNDLMIVQQPDSRLDHLVARQQILEPQLAIFEIFLDLLRENSGPRQGRPS
jgi:hypothetical protein